jgi:hypothetical protein
MGSVISDLERASCPECGTPGSVQADVCDLCLADLGERTFPPAAADPPPVAAPELRFSEVLEELRHVVALAADGPAAAAGRHAQSLLTDLRRQFLRDLGLPDTGKVGARGR